MRKPLITACLAMWAVCGDVPVVAQAPPVPDVLELHGDEQFEWISVRYASSPRADSLSAVVLDSYVRTLKSLPDDYCDNVYLPVGQEKLVRFARDVANLGLGTVLALEPGLGWGRAGNLVAVRVDRVVRAESDLAEGDVVFLFTSRVDTTVGGERFCAGSGNYVPVPQVDDAVLFNSHGPIRRDLEGLDEDYAAALEISTRSVLPILLNGRSVRVQGGNSLTDTSFPDLESLLDALDEK